MALFAHAPITKSIIFLTVVASILTNVFKLDNKPQGFEFWRFLASHFLFVGIGDMICGIVLLFAFRMFERQMGSKHYGAFVLLSLFFSTVLEIVFLFYFSIPVHTTSGPYFLIFSQLVMFYYDVPPLTPISFFTNDKMFTYLFALQLIFTQHPNSGYKALCGIIAGLLYRIEYLSLENLEVPDFVAKHCKKYILPLLDISPKPSQSPQNQQQTTTNQHLREPSVGNIETLINMGIDRETAVQALMRSNDELQIAIDSLFYH